MTTFNFDITPGESITITTHETRTIENGQIEMKFEKTYNVGDYIYLGRIGNITNKTIIINKGPEYRTKFHMKLDYFAEKMLISEIDQEFRLLYDPIEEVRENFTVIN